MTNKRKGTGVLASSTVSSSQSESMARDWQKLRENLKDLKDKKRNDTQTIIEDAEEAKMIIGEATQRLTDQSKKIQERLLKCIETEQHLLSTETDNVYLLEKEVTELNNTTTDLQQDLDELLQPLALRIKDNIYESKQYLEQENEEVELVQNKHLQQVPRLKEQISMYATTTGIKWDYDSETLLEGTMALPEQKTFIRFRIDPTENTPFAVANYLWDKMEGRSEEAERHRQQ